LEDHTHFAKCYLFFLCVSLSSGRLNIPTTLNSGERTGGLAESVGYG
jgi:hypothetical protein